MGGYDEIAFVDGEDELRGRTSRFDFCQQPLAQQRTGARLIDEINDRVVARVLLCARRRASREASLQPEPLLGARTW